MLLKRLIAVLLVRNGQVVQSVQFRHTNVIHWKPATAIDFFDRWAIDEMVVLDVTRDRAGRQTFYDTIDVLSKKCFVPLTIGGWVDSPDEVRRLLRLGADKVAVNTEAVRRPGLIAECARAFGSQCVVISIDAKRSASGDCRVVIDRGRHATELDPVAWARQAQDLGAGEIFLNSIDRDGFRQGYDLELVTSVVRAVEIPVVAMGGVFTWQHLVDGIVQAGADAVAAANIFHYTEHSTKKAKDFMLAAGVEVRAPSGALARTSSAAGSRA